MKYKFQILAILIGIAAAYLSVRLMVPAKAPTPVDSSTADRVSEPVPCSDIKNCGKDCYLGPSICTGDLCTDDITCKPKGYNPQTQKHESTLPYRQLEK